MKFFYAIKTCFQKYFTIRGTAGRSEFWLWLIFSVLILMLSITIDGALIAPIRGFLAFDSDAGTPLSIIIFLILLVPTITVTIRRFHDSGKSGWYLLGCILFAIVIHQLILLGSKALPANIAEVFSNDLLAFTGIIPLAYYLIKSGSKVEHRFTQD